MDKFAKLLNLIVLIPSIVKGVEAVKGAKGGAAKKEAVMDLVNAGFIGAGMIVPGKAGQLAAVQAGAGLIVDGTVAIFNATGVMKQSVPAK